jgi:hypothetical protein
MTNYELAESFRRIAKDLEAGGHPSNSSAKAIWNEAERLSPKPRKPREWVVGILPSGQLLGQPYEQYPSIRVREVIE